MARRPGTIGYLIPVGVTVGVLLVWARVAHPQFLPQLKAVSAPASQVASNSAPASGPAIPPPSDIVSSSSPPPPPPSDATAAASAAAADASMAAAPAAFAIRRVACTPDPQRSYGDTITPMTFLFDEERQCVNNRTPYVDAGKYWERFIVNSKDGTVSAIAVVKDYSAFIRLKYVLTPGQMAAWRSAERTLPQCGETQVQAQEIAAALNSVSSARSQLGAPAGVSYWTCAPS